MKREGNTQMSQKTYRWSFSLCNLRFADDIDLMGGTKEELQELTDRLTTASSAYGMEVSMEK